jgi:alkyl sulfatase BDS1-like metallo-beta-lactamase superfamily hydrolase
VIYTHSHADHFGGAKGVITEEDAKSGKVKVIAPDGFMEHAVAENVIAGNAMSRRAQYQFGSALPVGDRAQIDTGLGKALARGSISLIPPNDVIKQAYETRTVDGVDIEFHLVPGSEAPSEMIMYFPQFKLLNMAEDATHNMHNLYTLRGAEIRDGRLWSRYIGDAITRYGDKTDVVIAQHHWPMWGGERIVAFLSKQRDLYKFVHDQTVRLLNRGLTSTEIAEQLKLPPSLANDWAARLLRHTEPQRQGGLSILSWLVQCQSRRSQSAAACGGSKEAGGIHGRRGRDDQTRARTIRPDSIAGSRA